VADIDIAEIEGISAVEEGCERSSSFEAFSAFCSLAV